MKIRLRQMEFFVAGVVLLLMGSHAPAVIKIDMPLSKRFAISKTVMIGKVTGVNADLFLVDVTTVERAKNDASPANFRIRIRHPAELISAVKVGQPVVVMDSEGDGASIHLADTWLLGELDASKNPPMWSISQKDNNAAGKTFPGGTASLVRALEEIKMGKPTLIDDFRGKLFTGGVKELAKLDVAKPTFLLSSDINGDGKPDLVVGTATGVKLFLATASGYTDATDMWGLKDITASSGAAGDITGGGKIDLLLGGTLYLNDGQKFSSAPQAIKLESTTPIFASALIEVGGKRDAAFFLSDGRLLVFKNPGSVNTPWAKIVDRKLDLPDAPQAAAFGDFSAESKPAVAVVSAKSVSIFPLDGDEPLADFGRLTGDVLTRIKGFAGGVENPVITPMDVNGDHRTDLLITSDNAAMILVNRGFGTFLPDSDAAGELTAALAKTVTGRGQRTAIKNTGGADDLLVLSDDGRLLSAGNSGPAK